jgi:hypothetical protein
MVEPGNALVPGGHGDAGQPGRSLDTPGLAVETGNVFDFDANPCAAVGSETERTAFGDLSGGIKIGYESALNMRYNVTQGNLA